MRQGPHECRRLPWRKVLIGAVVWSLGPASMEALTFFSGRGALGGGQWNMNETESETKFDKLVSTAELHLESNSLTRVPSLKNMRSLTYLTLASNKITRIDAGTWLDVTDGGHTPALQRGRCQ